MEAYVSLDGILTFIHSLSLTSSNKKWLAERLFEEAKKEQSHTDRTDEMLDKHFGAWKDERNAEEIISEKVRQ